MALELDNLELETAEALNIESIESVLDGGEAAGEADGEGAEEEVEMDQEEDVAEGNEEEATEEEEA
jgi:hypothetical protein